MRAAEFRLQQVRGWSEKELQQAVIDLARALGWSVMHVYDSRRSEPGWPDLAMAHPRHGFILRELKTERGRLSPVQREWLDVLTKSGQDADIWRPRHWADRTIHRTLQPGSLDA